MNKTTYFIMRYFVAIMIFLMGMFSFITLHNSNFKFYNIFVGIVCLILSIFIILPIKSEKGEQDVRETK